MHQRASRGPRSKFMASRLRVATPSSRPTRTIWPPLRLTRSQGWGERAGGDLPVDTWVRGSTRTRAVTEEEWEAYTTAAECRVEEVWGVWLRMHMAQVI